jgi:hypothetical protein
MPRKLSIIEALTKEYAKVQSEANEVDLRLKEVRAKIEKYVTENTPEDGEGRQKEVTQYADVLITDRTTTKLKEGAIEALRSLNIDSLIETKEVVNESLLITMIKNGRVPKPAIEDSLEIKTSRVLRINIRKNEET